MWQPGRWTPCSSGTRRWPGRRPPPLRVSRRGDYVRWLDAWRARLGDRPRADPMDRVLHDARAEERRQRRHTRPWRALPRARSLGDLKYSAGARRPPGPVVGRGLRARPGPAGTRAGDSAHAGAHGRGAGSRLPSGPPPDSHVTGWQGRGSASTARWSWSRARPAASARPRPAGSTPRGLGRGQRPRRWRPARRWRGRCPWVCTSRPTCPTPRTPKRLIATTVERFGGLDVLVNNGRVLQVIAHADLDAVTDEVFLAHPRGQPAGHLAAHPPGHAPPRGERRRAAWSTSRR